MHNLLYLSYTIYYSPDFIWAWVSVYKYDRTHFLGRSEESEFVLTGNTTSLSQFWFLKKIYQW